MQTNCRIRLIQKKIIVENGFLFKLPKILKEQYFFVKNCYIIKVDDAAELYNNLQNP